MNERTGHDDPLAAPSVDCAEAQRFSDLALTWWDPGGPLRPLHRLNAVRVRFILEQACTHLGRDPLRPRPLAGISVLDIGCGGGILSESVDALGAEVVGIDVVERNIAVARSHGLDSGARCQYRAVSAEALARRRERFDLVLNMEVVEHVADLPAFLEACATLVRPGGLMVVGTINRTLRALLLAIVGAEYVLGWLPRGTLTWRRLAKPVELRALLRDQDMGQVAARGVSVNPLTRRYRLSSSLSVNYMLVFRKFHGDGDRV